MMYNILASSRIPIETFSNSCHSAMMCLSFCLFPGSSRIGVLSSCVRIFVLFSSWSRNCSFSFSLWGGLELFFCLKALGFYHFLHGVVLGVFSLYLSCYYTFPFFCFCFPPSAFHFLRNVQIGGPCVVSCFFLLILVTFLNLFSPFFFLGPSLRDLLLVLAVML